MQQTEHKTDHKTPYNNLLVKLTKLQFFLQGLFLVTIGQMNEMTHVEVTLLLLLINYAQLHREDVDIRQKH